MSAVYFIKPIDMDSPVKIGRSANPGRRAKSLETWTPFPLEVVAKIPGDNILEGRFHRAFLDSHQHGEWFRMSERLRDTIVAINAGRFDTRTLPAYAGVLKGLAERLKTLTPLDEDFLLARRRFLNLPWDVVHANGGHPPETWVGLKLPTDRKRAFITKMNAALAAEGFPA